MMWDQKEIVDKSDLLPYQELAPDRIFRISIGDFQPKVCMGSLFDV